MLAYHTLREDMRSGAGSAREKPWKVGEERTIRGKQPLVLCERGYHSCPTLFDCLPYIAAPAAPGPRPAGRCVMANLPAGVITYRVTSHNGAGVLAGGFKTTKDAKKQALKIAAEWLGPQIDIEIERVLTTGNNGHMYWVRKGRRWVPWDALADALERKPDFLLSPSDA